MSFKSVLKKNHTVSMENKESSEKSELLNEVTASLESLDSVKSISGLKSIISGQQNGIIKKGMNYLNKNLLNVDRKGFYINPFPKLNQSNEDYLNECASVNKKALEFIKDKIKSL